MSRRPISRYPLVVRGLLAGGLACFCLAGTNAAGQALAEVIVEIRVHGNHALSDDEVLALAGVAPGVSAGPDVVAEVERRLEESGRFESFEVRKRYQSLTATDQVSLILVVRERAGATSSNPIVRSFAAVGRRALFLPILDYTEGSGVTYGARTSFVDIAGTDGRLSIPATWGGTKQLALEFDKQFERGVVVGRLQAAASLRSSKNNHFELDDVRRQVGLSVGRRVLGGVGASAGAGWADVEFGSLAEQLGTYELGVEFDNRNDPIFPRNAVHASAGVTWLDVSTAADIVVRPGYEMAAFKGLWGQIVLTFRTTFVGANGPLPPYEQTEIGGGLTLRGSRMGEFIGDRALTASGEISFPMSSPLSVGDAGFSLFYDTATAYAYDGALADQRFHKGTGVGFFLRAPLVHLRLDVAHNLVDQVRLHVTAALTF